MADVVVVGSLSMDLTAATARLPVARRDRDRQLIYHGARGQGQQPGRDVRPPGRGHRHGGPGRLGQLRRRHPGAARRRGCRRLASDHGPEPCHRDRTHHGGLRRPELHHRRARGQSRPDASARVAGSGTDRTSRRPARPARSSPRCRTGRARTGQAGRDDDDAQPSACAGSGRRAPRRRWTSAFPTRSRRPR